MDAGIVEYLRAEEAALARKLKAVRETLSAYGEAASSLPATPVASRAKSDGGSREKVEITSFTEQTRASVLRAIQALLSSDRLLKTRDIVDFIESQGHEISGKNKVNALGALLARSVDVVGHGKSGWALADKESAAAILRKYLPKENEPESTSASGSDAAGTSGWKLTPAMVGSSSHWQS